jgi:hypothetical protein
MVVDVVHSNLPDVDSPNAKRSIDAVFPATRNLDWTLLSPKFSIDSIDSSSKSISLDFTGFTDDCILLDP